MRQLFHNNKLIFILYFLILIFSIAFLVIFGKKDSHFLLTACHSDLLNDLMKFFTFLGNGWFMVIVSFLLLFKKIRYGLIMMSSFLISSLFVQILKRFVFADWTRPVAWFHDLGIEIYRIEGLEYHSNFSFPSGHSTTAFALFFGLSFLFKNDVLKILFFFFAIVTAYSRIYLSQHFLEDAVAGSAIGILSSFLAYSYFMRLRTDWLDDNIVQLKRKKK